MKVFAFVKATAVNKKQLDQLWFEESILGAAVDEPHFIDDGILKPFQTCRELIHLEANSTQPGTGELSCTMITNQLLTLLAIDETAQLELAIAQNLSSGPGAQKLHDSTLASLPSRSCQKTLAVSIVEIEAVAASP